MSYTELEFDEASTVGLPRLVFFLDGTADLPAKLADADRSTVESSGSGYAMPGWLSASSPPMPGLSLRCSRR
jgi:hypothetical protein